jgi:hypothetical protein
MRPGSTFDAEAPVPINALGYRGPVPTTSPSDGPKRVVVMGDSVAFGASTSFPELLAQQLGSQFEVLNFGCRDTRSFKAYDSSKATSRS